VAPQNISGLRRFAATVPCFRPDVETSGYQDGIRSGCPVNLQIMFFLQQESAEEIT
jgi:hypothetical protein